jgi:putative transposase
MSTRKRWISDKEPVPVTKQCALASVNRSTVYLPSIVSFPAAAELQLLELIDKEYTRHPFYGSRKIMHYLRKQGYKINRKRVQRLMKMLGLAGMAPGPNTSKAHPEHKIYPYLLRGVNVTKPNQVWSTDITYIRLPKGFMYLVAVIDWYSRKVLSWRLSNSMESTFCVDCLQEALRKYGTPEVFNTDQGAQFTSAAFIGALTEHPSISISMDGRGRALDNIFVERLWRNVKHEDIYMNGYATPTELHEGLKKYFRDYNNERSHQSLGYSTPVNVYRTASGGGARIVDKYSKKNKQTEVLTVNEGQRLSAA